jgi:hypothetical protein
MSGSAAILAGAHYRRKRMIAVELGVTAPALHIS